MLESVTFMIEILLIVLSMDDFRVHLGKHPKDINVLFYNCFGTKENLVPMFLLIKEGGLPWWHSG